MIFQTFITYSKVYTSQDIFITQCQDLRSAIFMISREIRLAGCNPMGTQGIGFLNQEDPSGKDRYDTDSDSIHFSCDLSTPPDGKTDEPNEIINYYLYPDTGYLKKLGRRTGNQGSPQPVAENITQLVFTYFDQSNTQIDPGLYPQKIACIRISLTGESFEIDPVTHKRQSLTFNAYVRIRNEIL